MRRRDKEPPLDIFVQDRPHYRWALANEMLTWPEEEQDLEASEEIFTFAPIFEYVMLKPYRDHLNDYRIEPRFFALRKAEKIYEDDTLDSSRWMLEAYLSAGVEQQLVADALRIPINVVIAYEKAFFDVQLYIHDPSIFERFVLRYAQKTPYDGDSKYVAQYHGTKLYDFIHRRIQLSSEEDREEAERICTQAYVDERIRVGMGASRISEGRLEIALLNMKERALEIAAARTDSHFDSGRLTHGTSDAANAIVQAMAKAGKQVTQREIEKRAGEGTAKFVRSQQMSADKHALASMVTTLKNTEKTRDKE